MRIVTIRDVAREAGVSISTVSRVLNHREEVDPLTRENVDEVIERLNYVRNANASNLKQRHTGFVAVILRGRRNLFLTDLAERIVALGRQKHMQFLLEFIDDQADTAAVVDFLNDYHEERTMTVSGRVYDISGEIPVPEPDLASHIF